MHHMEKNKVVNKIGYKRVIGIYWV